MDAYECLGAKEYERLRAERSVLFRNDKIFTIVEWVYFFLRHCSAIWEFCGIVQTITNFVNDFNDALRIVCFRKNFCFPLCMKFVIGKKKLESFNVLRTIGHIFLDGLDVISWTR